MYQSMAELLPKPKAKGLPLPLPKPRFRDEKEILNDIKKEEGILQSASRAKHQFLAPSYVTGGVESASSNAVFSELNKSRTKLESLKNELWESQKRKKIAGYEELAKKEDYSTVSTPKLSSQDKEYQYINKMGRFSPNYKPDYQGAFGAEMSFMDSQEKERYSVYDEMTDKERRAYTYLYNKEGKKKAKEYLDDIREDLNRRGGEKIAAGFKDYPAAKVAVSPLVGIDNAATGLKQNLSHSKALSLSPLGYAGQEIRGSLQGLPAFGYDIGFTTGNMGPAIGASIATGSPAVGLAMTGLSAKGNAQREALNEGFSPMQAQAYGIAVGASEALLQKALGGISALGGGNIVTKGLNTKINAINNGLLRGFAKYGVSALSEGFEEGLQEFLEPVIKSAVLNAEYKPAELSQIAYASVLGMVSAGLFEAGEIYQGEKTAKALGEESKANGIEEVNALIQDGLQASPDSEGYAIANKLKKELDSGKPVDKLNNYHLGLLGIENAASKVAGDTKERRMAEIGQALGRKVNFFESESEGHTVNGFYKGGEIFINRKAKNPLEQVFSHELTHSLEGTDSYFELETLVFSRLEKSGDVSALIESKRAEYEKAGVSLTELEARAEIMAEYVEKNLLSSESEIRSLVKDNRTLAEKVYHWIEGIIQRIGARLGNKNAEEKVFLEKARDVYRKALAEDTVPSEGHKFLIRNDGVFGSKYVEIDKDILQGVPKKEWRKATADFLKNHYQDGINIGGQKITVGRKTYKEASYSRYSESLKKYEKEKFRDRMRAFGNADELIEVSRDFINEGLKKKRKDFQSFGKSNVRFKIGNKEYVATLVIGLRKDGEAVLYEITDMHEISILKNKKNTSATASTTNGNTAYFSGASNQSISQGEREVKRYSISSWDIDLLSDEAYEMIRDGSKEKPVRNVEIPSLDKHSMVKLNEVERAAKIGIKNALGFHKFTDKKGFDEAIRAISAEYIREGKVSEETISSAFNELYENVRIQDSEHYNKYKNLKSGIKDTKIFISPEDKANIPDFNAFRKKAIGHLTIVNQDGLPVDSFYEVLKGAYPELFPDSVTHPADQLLHIYDVAESIRIAEYRLDDYYGEVKAEFRHFAEKDFEATINEMTASLNIIRTFALDKKVKKERAESIQDESKMEKNRALANEEKRQLLQKKSRIQKHHLASDRDLAIAKDFSEGKITREMVTKQTKNTRAVFEIADIDKRLKEVQKELETLHQMERAIAAREEKAAEEREREWIHEPFQTYEEIKAFYEEKARLQKAYDKARRRLSEADRKLLDGLESGSIHPNGTKMLESDKKNDIIDAFNLWKPLERYRLKNDQYNKDLIAKRFAEVKKDLPLFKDAKEKAFGILYARETPQRIIEDMIPNKVYAEHIYQKYFGVITKSEAKMNLFKNRMKERVQKLNISRKVSKGDKNSESHAVQFIGEARYYIESLRSNPEMKEAGGYTLEQWEEAMEEYLKVNPNLDMEKIDRAIEEFHKIYDELFPLVNKAYIENGYEPIEYRKGYFPHFSEDLAPEGFLDEYKKDISTLFGLLDNTESLPTEIAGLTYFRKPGVSWFRNKFQRNGFATRYDALQGFDNYLNGAAKVIYLTSHIKMLRTLEQSIRKEVASDSAKDEIAAIVARTDISDEEKSTKIAEATKKTKQRLSGFTEWLTEKTNLIAGKTGVLDRATEALFSRNAFQLANKLIGRIAGNQIAGNLGSAVTNLIPLSMAAGQISRMDMAVAAKEYLKSLKVDDGFTARSTFLTNRAGYKPLAQSFSQKWGDKLSVAMEAIDMFAAQITVRARYKQNIRKGLSGESAMAEADSFAAKLMADRTRSAMPTFFETKSPLLKLLSMYQLEVNNQYSYLFKDLPRLNDKDRKKLLLNFLNVLISMWLYNEFYEFIFGRRAATDVIGILNETAGDFTGYKLPNTLQAGADLLSGKEIDFRAEKKQPSQALKGLGKNIAQEIPVVGSFLGGGRIPISSALPNTGKLGKIFDSGIDERKKWEIAMSELSKPLWYVAMPFAGGQAKKITEGGLSYLSGGHYTSNRKGESEVQFAVEKTPLNLVRSLVGGRMATPEAREWVDSGFRGLSAKETVTYHDLIASGMKRTEAFDAVVEMRRIKKNEETGESEKDLKLKHLENANLTGKAKASLYKQFLAGERESIYLNQAAERKVDMGNVINLLMKLKSIEGKGEAFAEREELLKSNLPVAEKERLFLDVMATDSMKTGLAEYKKQGLTVEDYIETKNKKSRLQKESKDVPKALEFRHWLEGKGYTESQKAFLIEENPFYSHIPQKETLYEKALEAGVSEEIGYQYALKMKELKPKLGQKMVSYRQKQLAVLNMEIPDSEKDKILSTLFTDSMKQKAAIAGRYGVSARDFVRYLAVLEDQGAGKGISQKEAERALRAMPISKQAKAVLWQIQNPKWKAKNNPFGMDTGGKVVAELKRVKKPALKPLKPLKPIL